MVVEKESIPHRLRVGLNHLSQFAICELKGSVDYIDDAKTWVLTLIIKREEATEYIPKYSEWKILIAEEYPFGPIGVYPSAENGVSVTFPHQERNDRGPKTRSWRDGKLCLDSPFGSLRFPMPERAPLGDPEEYLAWYIGRTIIWLELAADGELLAEGDPFEIPQIPLSPDAPLPIIVFDETPGTYEVWQNQRRYGIAQIGTIPGLDRVWTVGTFTDSTGKKVRGWEGRPIRESDEVFGQAFWCLWPDTVVLPPWYAPGTWGDLRHIGRELGVEVDGILRFIAPRIRGKKKHNVLLIGYPIPDRIGNAPSEIHWGAVILPSLPSGSGKPPEGFRPNEKGWWRRDRINSFRDDTTLVYCPTENWSPERLGKRGHLPEPIRKARTMIIGVGAFGSCVAELFTRMGTAELTLIDNDKVAAGNVCRHISTLAEVRRKKAEAVAQRLEQISPHSQVTAISESLPSSAGEVRELLDPYEIIIECTASDDVVEILARAWWSVPRLFISASVGYKVQRLFIFSAYANKFPLAQFNTMIEPWLFEERRAWVVDEELLEGAGCWSPLWPGRYDDITLAATVCLKVVERYFSQPPSTPVLDVFEQVLKDGDFISYTRVDSTAPTNDADAA